MSLELLEGALVALGETFPTPGELGKAYIELHGRLRTTYLSAVGRVASKGGKRYIETFREKHWRADRGLTAAARIIAAAEELPGLMADLATAMRRAELVAAAVGSFQVSPAAAADVAIAAAESLPTRVAGPFEQAFRRYLAAAAPRLTAAARGARLPLGAAPWDSPLLRYQVAIGHLIVAHYAFLAVYAAVPACQLYDMVDGNTGARAAAAKLGMRLKSADGTAAVEADVFGLAAAAGGALADYAQALWSRLGVIESGARSPLAPFVQLSERLVTAELGNDSQKLPGLRADSLASWGSASKADGEPVPRRVPFPASGRFVPTWPPIAARREHVLNRSNELADPLVIMHAEPGAQLGLLVAAQLYGHSGPYLSAPPDPVRHPEMITVTAGSLEFGGRHHPHDTHRSGVEIDVDQAEMRNLDNTNLPRLLSGALRRDGGEFWLDQKDSTRFFRHFYWARLLQQAIAAPRVTLEMPFAAFRGLTLDRYATRDPRGDPLEEMVRPRCDTVRDVAKARALCISILLSGASRLLFGDPWVFIDGFHRLAAVRAVLAPDRVAHTWPVPDVVLLEPYAHHNHWHAEWRLRLDPTVRRPRELIQTAPGPDVFAWAPLWRALGVELNTLTDLLADIEEGSPSYAGRCRQLAELLERRWDVQPPLPDLYEIVYGGAPGERALLVDTAHTGG